LKPLAQEGKREGTRPVYFIKIVLNATEQWYPLPLVGRVREGGAANKK
jgi:hypothetical protein